ncbi:hypothetical protein LTR27_001588 [Elasticomyces elasticus]|nr:hypothetical protein LTR27_001588 [Elasticomyces elasticus]
MERSNRSHVPPRKGSEAWRSRMSDPRLNEDASHAAKKVRFETPRRETAQPQQSAYTPTQRSLPRGAATRDTVLSQKAAFGPPQRPTSSPAQQPVTTRLQQVVSTMADRSPLEGSEIHIGLDYGSKQMAGAVLIARAGEEPTPLEFLSVVWDGGKVYAQQRAGWGEGSKFYWGDGVRKALNEDKMKPEQVIELWKLNLYPDHVTSPMAVRVTERLAKSRHSLFDLLSTHFGEVVSFIDGWIKKPGNMQIAGIYSPEQLNAMPRKVFISVPQMWKQPANRLMTEAALKAGIGPIELVYEPHSAAGYFLATMKNIRPAYLAPDDQIIVADVGGGTGDFLALAFEGPARNDERQKLKIVGNPEGRHMLP